MSDGEATLSFGDGRLTARPQPFEAGFVGGPVWRVRGAPDAAAAAALVAAARRRDVRLAMWRGDEADAAALAVVGFRRVETLTTLACDLAAPHASATAATFAPGAPGAPVALAGESDRAACLAVGRRAFAFDRFHRDADRLGDIGDAIKAAWVDNAFAGRADAVLTARRDGAAVGFVICLRDGADAVIDLIAVDAPWRGRGIGAALVAGASALYRDRGAARMLVGTQDDNAASLDLYRRMGFVPIRHKTTCHWTPERASAP